MYIDGVDMNNYTCSDKGMFLPLFSEITWSREVRAFLYLAGLLWSFLGVAIIADTFMSSIEKITSKTRKIRVANPDSSEGFEEIEVQVWNDTVANLTLMALGSSAPEILLSCIEIVGNGFKAGDLGPSTIVGSAAFNLFVISGVCVIAIPSPETRTIKETKVFAVTAIFSLIAYIWLIIVLKLVSPDVVELWEAIVTLLMFPALVLIAYIANKNFFRKSTTKRKDMELGFDEKDGMPSLGTGKMTERKMRDFLKHLKSVHPDMDEEEMALLASKKIAEETPHDRMWYRINATRFMGGGRKMNPTVNEHLQDVLDAVKEHGENADIESLQDFSLNGKKAVVEFTASSAAVLEQDGRVRIGIRRYGKTDSRVIFKIETIDGTAESEKDYIPVKSKLVFEREEKYKTLDIEIIDDNEWEPDEVFFVKLSLDPHDVSTRETQIGKKSIMEVTIINDDEPGNFEFDKPSNLFKESAGKALIAINRVDGADGKVELKWKTTDMTAKTGKDYEGGEGTLVFNHGETCKNLEIPLHDDQEAEKDESFLVELLEVSEGAKLGRIKKTIVTIVNDDDFNGMVSRLVDMTNMNMDSLRVDSQTWGDQFKNAMNVNGGDVEGATAIDYVMHFCTFFWKIIFALCPPPSYLGGWCCFFIALLMIGLLTALISDLASIFGCLVGLKDSVTAITFVALGTSLPDLFASKTAATQEKHADNCIGNVTGSNSVNVFLGLGLPWTIAAIYWTAKGSSFKMPAGSLGFSVVIFTVFAIICLGTIVVRRHLSVFGKGELGGPTVSKFATFAIFVTLWILYVLLSSLEAYGHIKPNF